MIILPHFFLLDQMFANSGYINKLKTWVGVKTWPVIWVESVKRYKEMTIQQTILTTSQTLFSKR